MEARVMSWARTKAKENKAALLRSRIELAQTEARAYIEDKAAEIRKECPNVPFESIVVQLRRSMCDCTAALYLMDQKGD
jgi:hypothetical protein